MFWFFLDVTLFIFIMMSAVFVITTIDKIGFLSFSIFLITTTISLIIHYINKLYLHKAVPAIKKVISTYIFISIIIIFYSFSSPDNDEYIMASFLTVFIPLAIIELAIITYISYLNYNEKRNTDEKLKLETSKNINISQDKIRKL